MNKGVWKSLPPDIKKVFEEVSKEWAIKHAKEAWDGPDLKAVEYCRSKGMKFFKLPPAKEARWKKAVAHLEAKYIKEKTAMGLPAAEYIKFIKERLKYWDKKVGVGSPWGKFVESLPDA